MPSKHNLHELNFEKKKQKNNLSQNYVFDIRERTYKYFCVSKYAYVYAFERAIIESKTKSFICVKKMSDDQRNSSRKNFEKRSFVWKNFQQVSLNEATCNICDKKIAFNGTTTSLIYHLKRLHQITKSDALNNEAIQSFNEPDVPIYTEADVLSNEPDISINEPNEIGIEPIIKIEYDPETYLLGPNQNHNRITLNEKLSLLKKIKKKKIKSLKNLKKTTNFEPSLNRPSMSPFGAMKKFNKRSFVWKNFKQVSNNEATCNVCSQKISYNGTTTCLIYHLKKLHHITNSIEIPSKQSLVKNNFNKKDKEMSKMNETKQKILDEKLCLFFAKCNLPLSVTQNKQFQDFTKELNKNYEPPSQQYATNSILPELVIFFLFDQTNSF